MKILGIESSCDETAAAVVEDGFRVVSDVVHSQIDIHKKYGGVVPEVAARSHIEVVNAVIEEAVEGAGLSWEEIDAMAVTYAPGLIGSLMVGTLTARTWALLKGKPLQAVNHIQAHVYANFVGRRDLEFPILALVVSGGHTQLVLMERHGDFRVIGGTKDDAAGECFDKAAKILGLDYPGGPAIAAAAVGGEAGAYRLPKPRVEGAYDFSFSGLKTALLRAAQGAVGRDFSLPSGEVAGLLSEQMRCDFAAGFQRTAVEVLVEGLEKAARDFCPRTVVLAGGVASNLALRAAVRERISGARVCFPAGRFCTDNAVMVGVAGFFQIEGGGLPADVLDLEVFPSK
jgi:N6-L-threonylcarbamoyladenine synthase